MRSLIQMVVEPDEKNAWMAIAEERDTTLSEFIRTAIREKITREVEAEARRDFLAAIEHVSAMGFDFYDMRILALIKAHGPDIVAMMPQAIVEREMAQAEAVTA